jgi:hypothetical protein
VEAGPRFKRVAEADHVDGMTMLGVMYLRG